jgi:hypothetical protein
MRRKQRLMLVGPALLTAFAFGPTVVAEASVAPGPAKTTAISVLENATTAVTAPDKPPNRRREYNEGHQMGLTEGRTDCRAGMSFDYNRNRHNRSRTMSENWTSGYHEGYTRGFNSCSPAKKRGEKAPDRPMEKPAEKQAPAGE